MTTIIKKAVNPRCSVCAKEAKHKIDNIRYCRAHFLQKFAEDNGLSESFGSSRNTSSSKSGRSYCPNCGKRGTFGFQGCTKQQLYCKEHRPYEDMVDIRNVRCCACNKQAIYTHTDGSKFCGEHMQQAIREAQMSVKVDTNSDQIVPCTSAFSYDKKSGQFFSHARPEVLPKQEMPGVETRGRPKDEQFQGYGKNVKIILKLNLPAV